MKKAIIGILCFLIAGVGGFFSLKFFREGGFSLKPGEIVFSENFPEDEKDEYLSLFSEKELKKDLSLSYEFSDSILNSSNAGERFILIDALVPVDDFYSTKESISQAEFDTMINEKNINVVSVSKLTPDRKLLQVDGKYFLDLFSSGAKFQYLKVSGSDEDIAVAEQVLAEKQKKVPEKKNTLSFVQTGVTAFGRGMNAMMNEVGDGLYFSEKIGTFLSSFDLTHTSNEASFSDSASESNICADNRFAETLKAIGLDIVELTGNHNLDCGAVDAINTVDKYTEMGVQIVGGGKNAEEAGKELEISQKGNIITMLAYNQSTSGATTDANPGANQYSEEDARAKISEAKGRGDVVIVDMQYYECAEYDTEVESDACTRADSSAGDQIGVFRSLIDMGADIVVGTSAHQTQTYEKYKNGFIYYGLGNIFFDQYWWPGTTKSLGLVHYFWGNSLVQTRRFGTIYDENLQTRLMGEDEFVPFIEKLNEYTPE